ncbi:DUF2062 domain-containing protein [Granulicella tundricola]|nr:DUF2062 domain-containing protein [Granulicella tundricola]
MAASLTASISLLFQRHIISPVMHLLRVGASPRRLAWSLAVGVAVGINPLLGSTTLLCLAVAFVLRLNLVASQISNHLVYPLQLALFFVFIDIGDRIFHTGKLPLDREALLSAMRHHPLATTRMLWSWEWHALIVWTLFSAALIPLVALILRPALERLLLKLHTETPA